MSLTVPSGLLPVANNIPIGPRRNTDIMRRLENLEATVKANKETNDRWLKEREEWYEDSEESFEMKREARMKRFEATKQRLEKQQERLNETINILLEDQLTQCQEALKRAILIRKFETFYRILQVWNNRLFSELRADYKWILRNAELDYITKLLEAPINTDTHLFEPVSNALGLLSAEEYSVANAILPILFQLKRDCTTIFGWNRILHTAPTIAEGISDIEQSTLEDNHKATLIAAIRKNPKSSSGADLFLPVNFQTKVGDLEKRIQHLEESLEN